jgi:hypothetical protein
VFVVQFHAKHGAGQNGRYPAFYLYVFFFH